MTRLFANNATTTLASGISSGATSLTVATGTGALFPALSTGQTFLATLTQAGVETSWEIVTVTARSGDVFTITRGQEGTTPAGWSTGATVSNRLTAGSLVPQRGDVSVTTGSLVDLAEETGTIALGKFGRLFKVTVDRYCRVRLYKTSAFRTSDAGRGIGSDPAPTSGVLSDLVFDTTTGLTLSLVETSFENEDTTVSNIVYYAIQNRSGSTAAVTATFTVLALES